MGMESLDLGARIVRAARLAAAVHLYESAREIQDPRRRVGIGGTGPVRVMEDMPPVRTGGVGRSAGAGRAAGTPWEASAEGVGE